MQVTEIEWYGQTILIETTDEEYEKQIPTKMGVEFLAKNDKDKLIDFLKEKFGNEKVTVI